MVLRFVCKIGNQKIETAADSASDLDLMSLSYAEAGDFKIMVDEKQILLADSTTVCTTARVLVALELTDGRTFLKFLDILPGLQADVLLGEDTLESIDAFGKMQQDLVERPACDGATELHIMSDLRTVLKKIARLTQSSNGKATPPECKRHASARRLVFC